MLFLKFQIGAEGYLLEAAQIVEILPLVSLKHLPQAPLGVAGLLNYRGTAVPVIDLSQLAVGRPAARLLSTRIILVHYDAGGTLRLLGLVVEKATETLQREAADFTDAGVMSGEAPYLGAVTREAQHLLQRIELQKLLPESLSTLLYRRAEEESWSSSASKLS